MQQVIRLQLAGKDVDFDDLTYRLKGKKLLFEPDDEEEKALLSEHYRHGLEFVDREAIRSAIIERNPDEALLILHHGDPFRMYVFDLETRDCIYQVDVWKSQSTGQKKLTKAHVKRLNDLVENGRK